MNIKLTNIEDKLLIANMDNLKKTLKLKIFLNNNCFFFLFRVKEKFYRRKRKKYKAF